MNKTNNELISTSNNSDFSSENNNSNSVGSSPSKRILAKDLIEHFPLLNIMKKEQTHKNKKVRSLDYNVVIVKEDLEERESGKEAITYKIKLL